MAVTSNTTTQPTPQSTTYTFYFGGELFSSKHLLGNAVLAESIFQRSHGKYQAVLPQNLEQRDDTTPHAIRDSDIQALLACDLGLFHYDGPELDSGTVVEFMLAKFADMPAVLVRSDFRGGGDQAAGAGEPWNLMSSFFPRTASVVVDAMALYTRGMAALVPEAPANVGDMLKENRSARAGQAMIDVTADAVIAAFDKVVAMPSIMPTPMQDTIYQWLAVMPGFKHSGEHQVARLKELCAAKKAKGLL